MSRTCLRTMESGNRGNEWFNETWWLQKWCNRSSHYLSPVKDEAFGVLWAYFGEDRTIWLEIWNMCQIGGFAFAIGLLLQSFGFHGKEAAILPFTPLPWKYYREEMWSHTKCRNGCTNFTVVPSRLEQVRDVVWLKRELRYLVGKLGN